MLKTKELLNQIETLTSNLPVYIIAELYGNPMKTYGLESFNLTTMVDESEGEAKRAVLLTTTTTNSEEGLNTHASVKHLEDCIKDSISNNSEEIHIFDDEINSSAPLERIVTSEEMVILVIDWLELLTTNATCKEIN